MRVANWCLLIETVYPIPHVQNSIASAQPRDAALIKLQSPCLSHARHDSVSLLTQILAFYKMNAKGVQLFGMTPKQTDNQRVVR